MTLRQIANRPRVTFGTLPDISPHSGARPTRAIGGDGVQRIGMPSIEQETTLGHELVVKVGVTDADSTHVRLDRVGSNSERDRHVLIELLHHYLESGMLLCITARVEANGPIPQVSAAAAP